MDALRAYSHWHFVPKVQIIFNTVKLGHFTSPPLTTNIGAPQGCVLSPALFSLYTNDCISGDPTVKLLKYADDTTVIGLIRDGDESAYRKEVDQLVQWCGQNHMLLNPK